MNDKPAGLVAPPGMRDLLPGEVEVFQRIESAARATFRRYGFDEVRTPMVEHTEVFSRGVGEGTDIVQKEMYTFLDRSNPPHSLTLRPEGTAPAVRAYVEHSAYARDALTKWFYLGPMFRYERMQKGRTRQFHQVGAEAFGAAGPDIDAEMVDLAMAFLGALGVSGLTVGVSSLGDAACRPAYVALLTAHLRGRAADLCDDCRSRLDRNPLRVLDCKAAGCQAAAASAPTVLASLCGPCHAHFDGLRGLLDALGIRYAVDPKIVRGLDYYTRTVFEILAEPGEGALGSQNAVCGGGRYDDLVRRFGGPDVPAIGFAAGVERISLLMSAPAPAAAADLFVATIGETPRKEGLRLAQAWRASGLHVELDERGGSLKSQLRRADKRRARFSIVLGENELASGRVQLKRMADGTGREVGLTEMPAVVRAG